MKRLMLLCPLILASVCWGQSELPDAPDLIARPKYSHALFVLEVGALTAANIQDGRSTVRMQDYGYQEIATPWLLGRHPNGWRYTAVYGGLEVAQVLSAWKLENNSRKWVRVVGHGIMWASVAAHAWGYVNNLKLEHD